MVIYNYIVGDKSCVIMGDVNVSLRPDVHSEGMSYSTQDMIECQDCINCIENIVIA